MILQAFLVRYGKTSKYLKHNDEFLVGRRAFIWEYPVTEYVVSVTCLFDNWARDHWSRKEPSLFKIQCFKVNSSNHRTEFWVMFVPKNDNLSLCGTLFKLLKNLMKRHESITKQFKHLGLSLFSII